MFKLKVIRYWLQMKFRKEFKSRDEIIFHQDRKLENFARHVLAKSTYYRKYFKDGKFHWSAVPLISKSEFMEHFDEINTVGIKKDHAMQVAVDAETIRDFGSTINGITIGLSTGTSGKRGLFLVSESERAQWAALVMSKVVKPQAFRKKKVAFFLRANSNLYSAVASSLLEFRYYDIFRPIEELLKELHDFQPDIVAAQPSILVEIAKAQVTKTIIITPEQLISFAEVLHEDDKKYILEKLPAHFTEIYQCTEGFLGISCVHGTMHLNEQFIRVEKEMIEGNMFHPVITDFSRTSQPVVKYRLDDILVEKESPCACGSKLMAIERIIGRDDDVLEFAGKNGGVKVYPDLISRRIALATETHFNYQLRQKDVSTLNVYSDIEKLLFGDFKIMVQQELNKLLAERGVAEIKYEFYNYLDHTKGNKNRRITKQFV